jgi:predicted O-linked N-acetylglucosamine transferase (SPINDLY family)
VAAFLLGQALAQALRLREAVPVLRRAIALDPEDPTVQLALAVCLIRMHRPREARALLEALPPEVSVLCNLAGTIAACGSQQEAAALARRTVAEHPRSVMARKGLPSVLAYTPGVTGAELTEALVACGATLPRTPRPPIADPRPDRRLRIGLLSGSLRTHPVGWLTIGAFEALDRADFTIACFGRYAAGDALTRRFAACAESWTELDGLDETGIAAAIRAAAIDILIDLGGYGDTGHMTVCASRPAPVQMKWVGMQYHTTGLPEIDWFVTDRWETPESLASLYTERLLTMPDGYVCYSPPAYAPPVSPLPMLEHGFPTFGCCNNLSKITPVVIETWARILTARPDARLLLRTQQFSEPETI